MNTGDWTSEQRALWARLCAFDLDEPHASLDFSRRLARENGWTHAFASRVVQEYKRFLFLAMCAGHPVTPSDEVDQAWHLHLVYTRSYWDELCKNVLRAPLHHGPTRGGASEGAKFGQWYAQTRASYARFFGEEPPADIWPAADVRFGEAPHFRRINARRSWIVQKPQPRVPTRIAPALLIGAMLVGAGGVAVGAPLGLNVWNWNGPEFLMLFWMLSMVGLAAMFWAGKQWVTPNDEQPVGVAVDAYLIARLRAHNELPVDVAIVHLIAENRIAFDEWQVLQRTGMAPTHPFERDVWDGIGTNGKTSFKLRETLRPRCQHLDKELKRLGLLIADDVGTKLSLLYVFVPLLLLLLGGSKIVVGMSRDRPVGFLVASCLVVVVAAFFLWTNIPRRTGRGDAFLAHMQRQHGRGSLSLPDASGSPGNASDGLVAGVALSMALYGYDELDAFGMGGFRERLQPPKTNGDGSSGCSSSGCGSDSGGDSGGDGGGSGCGGGGCGGCGGCGS